MQQRIGGGTIALPQPPITHACNRVLMGGLSFGARHDKRAARAGKLGLSFWEIVLSF